MASLTSEGGEAAGAATLITPDEEFKKQGNLEFSQQNYEAAVACYTKGLAVNEQNHTLFGNRSGAYLKLGQNEEALADANSAIALKPSWLKPYHRKACALQALERYAEAVEAYEKAVLLDPKAPSFGKLLKAARNQLKVSRTRSPVRDLEHWLQIHQSEPDPRMRLGIMAEFWNLSSQEDRLLIFNSFLTIISGSTPSQAPTFAKEDMTKLPMKNYEDLLFPREWTKYFAGLSAMDKATHFEQMFEAASEAERTLIINDLKHFFRAPV
jgi:tetratricopeptide (TPR) repeat protein